jgi:hypothetical protein
MSEKVRRFADAALRESAIYKEALQRLTTHGDFITAGMAREALARGAAAMNDFVNSKGEQPC